MYAFTSQIFCCIMCMCELNPSSSSLIHSSAWESPGDSTACLHSKDITRFSSDTQFSLTYATLVLSVSFIAAISSISSSRDDRSEIKNCF